MAAVYGAQAHGRHAPPERGYDIDPGADRLFVTKIPQQATREDIAGHFARFGTTTDVYLPSIPGMPGHKGIAFVSFAEPTALQLAINNGPHDILGHEVVVDVAAPRGAQPMANQVGMSMGPPSGGNEPLQDQAAADRLFVTKVPPALQREHLRDHFAQFGELTDVYMPAVPGGTTHKGICFVSFSDPSALQLALQHSPHEVRGHQVVVDVAAPRGPVPGPVPARSTGMGIPPHPMGMGLSAGPAEYRAHAPSMSPIGSGIGGWGPPQHSCGGYTGPPHSPASYYDNPYVTGGASAQAAGTPVPGRLFVTRVTPDMTKVDLQLYFQQYGQLDDVYIPTGGKGIAFISFREAVVSQRVLQAQQHFVKPGKAVLVDQAIDRPPLPGKGMGGGSGHAYAYGGGYGGYGGGMGHYGGGGGAGWGPARHPQAMRYMPY